MEKEFETKYLAKIREVLRYALESPYSDFYRRKYAGLGIDPKNISSYEDFQKIPFLTRDELLGVGVEDKIFVPKDEITHYALSSGTENTNKPLLMAHACPDDRPYISSAFDEAEFIRLGAHKIMNLCPPLSAHVAMINAIPKKETIILQGDPNKLALSAYLAKEAGIEGVFSTPTIFYLFSEELKKLGFDPKSLKLILLFGEILPKNKLEYLRNAFPSAKFLTTYNGAEAAKGTAPKGYQCNTLAGEPNLFHIHQIYYLEFVNNDGSLTKPGEIGEIVQTDLFIPNSFPFIRYRTDDLGKYSEHNCPCGEKTTFSFEGRANYKILKFGGVSLRKKAIDTALGDTLDRLKWYQVHVYDEKYMDKILSRLVLEIVPVSRKDTNLEKDLLEKLSQNLFLAQDKNLDYFVKNNIFLPLEIKALKNIPSKDKNKTIVSHLS